MRFSTRAIHAGQDPDPVTGSVTVPVYLTSTYQQPGPGKEGKYVYSRTANPTNPLMRIVDIRQVSKISNRAHALLVVDNTFMSPYLQNPLEHGADIVVHSTTKYLGGHSDLIGGATITKDDDVQSRLKYLQNAVGAIPGPLDCYLVLRGIKTLAVRMDRHNENTRTISEFLAKQPKVEKVNYPGLPDHPQRGIIKRQMKANGGMLSFQLKGGFNQCKKLLESLRIFTVAESLGGVESLIEHPASMTHASVPRERRLKLGISDNLIRVSVGIEDAEDLVQDLNRGFKAI